MKKTKFEILIFICMILLGLGCFLIATKNNQYNFFEDILSRYPEENIAGTLMVDLTHDGNDELLVISQDALEITVEISIGIISFSIFVNPFVFICYMKQTFLFTFICYCHIALCHRNHVFTDLFIIATSLSGRHPS